MRYVAALEHYPNCRSCDSGYPNGLKFFNSIREVLEMALRERDDMAIGEVHGTKSGKDRFYISYEIGRHSCIGLRFEAKGLKLRTIDNGSGKLVWSRV